MFVSLQGQTDCFSLSGCSPLSPQLHLTLGVSQSPFSLANICQSFSPCTIMVGPMVPAKVTGGQWCLASQQWSIFYPWVHGQPIKVSSSTSSWSSPERPDWSWALVPEHHSAGIHLLHGISKTVLHVRWNIEVAGEGQKDELLPLLGWDLAYQRTLPWLWPVREEPGTVQPSAGTSKGRKAQAIPLVLNFRLAGVPGLWEPRSSLFGPQFRWKGWLNIIIS